MAWSGPPQLPPPPLCSRGWRKPQEAGRGAHPTKAAALTRPSRGSSSLLYGTQRRGSWSHFLGTCPLAARLQAVQSGVGAQKRAPPKSGTVCLSHAKLHSMPTSAKSGHCFAARTLHIPSSPQGSKAGVSSYLTPCIPLPRFTGWHSDAASGTWRRFAHDQVDPQIDGVISEAAAEYKTVSLSGIGLYSSGSGSGCGPSRTGVVDCVIDEAAHQTATISPPP